MTEPNDVAEAVEILEEGSREEQKEALEALKNLSHTQLEAVVPHLEVICGFDDDERSGVRHDVAIILVNAANSDPSAVIPYADTVHTLLADNRPFILSAATATAESLVRESPVTLSDSADKLLDLLTYEKDWASGPASKTRARAAATLGYLGEADPTIAVQTDTLLVDRLDDPEPEVRAAVVMVITQLGLAHPETVSTALTHLPERLNDDHEGVRRNTILAYIYFQQDQPAAISQPDAVAPELKQAAERTDLDREEANTVANICQEMKNTSE